MVSGILVAAGRGTRMGPGTDKLFLEIAGRPLIAHTWRRLDESAAIAELVLVVREGMESTFRDMAGKFHFKKPFTMVPGGAERQDSVWNGLQAVSPGMELVLIHDAARPCVSGDLLEATIAAAREVGASVAAQRVTDTLKQSDGANLIQRTVDRSRLWAVQTPQTFRLEVIQRALKAVREAGLQFTDDTAACEFIGQPVQLVESTQPNPKATAPRDLPYLEWLLMH